MLLVRLARSTLSRRYIHQAAEHAVISTFDLFSIGGTSCLSFFFFSFRLLPASGPIFVPYRWAYARRKNLYHRSQRLEPSGKGTKYICIEETHWSIPNQGQNSQDQPVMCSPFKNCNSYWHFPRYGSLAATGMLYACKVLARNWPSKLRKRVGLYLQPSRSTLNCGALY